MYSPNCLPPGGPPARPPSEVPADGGDRVTGGRQVIPRPAAWAPVPPKRWRSDLGDLGALVSRPPVAPIGARPTEMLFSESRLSAVLVLLTDALPQRPGIHVLTTRRASSLRSHASEVSFPGGRLERGETPPDAALREAHEEVGLDPDGVALHGELTHVNTYVSRNYIVPIIATVTEPPVQFTLDPQEVETAEWTAIADLVVPGVHHTERWVRGEYDSLIEFFELPDDTIWGATARMLVDLLAAHAAPGAG